MKSAFQPCPSGMTTLAPRQFIVCRRVDHQNPYWVTRDGKSWFSASDLFVLAQELGELDAQNVFALPSADAPRNISDLTAAEQAQLLNLLGRGPT